MAGGYLYRGRPELEALNARIMGWREGERQPRRRRRPVYPVVTGMSVGEVCYSCEEHEHEKCKGCVCSHPEHEPRPAPPVHPFHQAVADAMKAGGSVPVGDMVLCDLDSTDLTYDSRSGGFLFCTYGIGPCCAERFLATVRGNHEEHLIEHRCPEDMSYADWIRSIRPAGAAVSVEGYYRPRG